MRSLDARDKRRLLQGTALAYKGIAAQSAIRGIEAALGGLFGLGSATDQERMFKAESRANFERYDPPHAKIMAKNF
jgi:hypothetical protein